MTTQLTFGSLFAGIGGFDCAFIRNGFRSSFAVEIDRNCNKLRKSHWPDEEQHTDVTAFTLRSTSERPDVICGGFPCQDLSVAGQRAGLAGDRSGLWFEFARIIAEFLPRVVCIENVPGLLSSDHNRDMGTILWTLGQLGYGWAYRVLDAQWLRVAQRRRRVFIVGCLGNGRRAAEILFERESLPWDPPPSREKRADVAPCVRGGIESGSNEHGNKVAMCLNAKNGKRYDGESESFVIAPALSGNPYGDHESREGLLVAHTLRGEGFDASEDGTGRGTPLVVAFAENQRGEIRTSDVAMQLSCSGGKPGSGYPAIAYRTSGNSGVMEQGDKTAALNCASDPNQNIVGIGNQMRVRRLTPLECERLQGFPDLWTEGFADSVRYRMLGNAVAVPVAQWIGERIVAAFDSTNRQPWTA